MKRISITLQGIVVFIMAMGIISACSKKENEQTETSKPAPPSHALYTSYRFSKDDRVIGFGIQPLWFPTALITEAMRRDAILEQALAESGMSIRFYSFLKGDDLNLYFINKNIDVGVAGDMPAITVASTAEVLVPILIHQGFISVISNRYMLLKELRGESVGYAFGASAHLALLNALASEGIGEKDVRLVSMDILQMPSALENGDIHAFTSWEPNTKIIMNTHKNWAVIHRSQFSGYMYFQKTFADKQPKSLDQIMAAEIRAMRWLVGSRENLLKASRWALTAAETISGNKPALTVEQCAEVAAEDLPKISASGPIIPEKYLAPEGSLSKEFEFLKSVGKIPDSVSLKRLRSSFQTETVKKIIVNPQQYRLNEFNYHEEIYENRK